MGGIRLGWRCASAALLWSATAWAQQSELVDDVVHDEVHLGVSAGARFPMSAVAALHLEMPGRLRLSAGMGAVPSQFLGAINDALVSFEAYRPEVGDFALRTIRDTRVLQAGVAWRPVPRSGFFVEGGYSLVTVNAAVDSSEIVSGYASPQPSGAAGTPASELTMRTSLHMVSFEGGWHWNIGHSFIRASVGGAFTASSQSELQFTDPDGSTSDLGPVGSLAESYVERALEKHAHTPFAGVQLGYRFF